jgi:proline iminopeptidase
MSHQALHPPIEPLSTGFLPVGDGHEIFWEQSGNPDGTPVLFLHGGPGAGASPTHRRFFDPRHYRILMFDQRGAGRSRPHAETRANTLGHLVADIETLRRHLGLGKWMLFGGSWGSTLALAYAQAHPARVTGMVVYGVCLLRRREIDWFLYAMGAVFPEEWDRFLAVIPEEERGDLLAAYHRRLTDPDPALHLPAARAWARYEGRCSTFRPQRTESGPEADRDSLALARLESHYFATQRLSPDDALLQGAGNLSGIPGIIVQGRYDMICPPVSAYELHRAWPGSELVMVPEGAHASSDPAMARALVDAADRLRRATNGEA